jgi:uncharacterized protein
MYTAALDNPQWFGPIKATAPEPVTIREFVRTLGRVLHRPAFLPVAAFALRVLYGDMASVVTTGQRAIPARATAHGFKFRHGTIHSALAGSDRVAKHGRSRTCELTQWERVEVSRV